MPRIGWQFPKYENQKTHELVIMQNTTHSSTFENFVVKNRLLKIFARVLILMKKAPKHPPIAPIMVPAMNKINMSLVDLTAR